MTTIPKTDLPTDTLRSMIAEELDELVALRHDLHAHPELMYEESRTSSVVQNELRASGVDFVAGLAGGTGVLGHLPGASSTAIGLRADMDALPIEEETGKPYTSTTPGIMHACGHDGHTTILIGAARVLSKLASQHQLPHPVTFLFQPAEEGGGGGRRMVEDGCLRGSVIGPPVGGMYGLHGWPQMQLGQVGTRPGPLLAAADKFEILVRGRGAHAAFPHTGNDAIVAASAIVTALQTIVSRNTSPMDALVVSVTQFHAGTTHNVLPEEARIAGTVRSLTPETKTLAVERIARIAESIANAHQCAARLDYTDGYPVTRNDDEAAAHFTRIARAALGDDRVITLPTPYMGAEDFSFYCHEVPSCFFLLGLSEDPGHPVPSLHHPKFDFEDAAISPGVELFCRLALAS